MVENNSQFDKDDRRQAASSPEANARADASKVERSQPDEDDLDFVVTETAAEQRDFVGGPQQVSTKDDPLEIEASAGSGANPSDDPPARRHYETNYSEPIGMSEPPPPPGADENPTESSRVSSNRNREMTAKDQAAAAARNLRKLSDAEIRSIREKMYGQSNGLSEKEKQDLLEHAEKQERPLFKNEPIVPPKKKADRPEFDTDPVPSFEPPKLLKNQRPPKFDSDLSRPHMAPSERGTAFFFRNYVELVGRHDLTAGDNLTVNGRDFELKPKTVNSKVLYGSAAVVGLILLFIIGAFFVGDPTGEGQLMGVVLDADNRPFIQEASIRFPELGRTVKSNAQGFFSLGDVAEGSYKIQYVLKDKVVGEDYATVVNGEVTLVALRPGSVGAKDNLSNKPATEKETVSVTPSESQPVQNGNAAASVQSKPAQESTPTRTPAKTNTGSGSVRLLANIEGAKFELDGRTLGAGNITYSKINSGRRKYDVSADGYQSETGWVEVAGGETTTLKVVLSPMTSEAKVDQFTSEDFYRSGMNALKESRNETAVSDLTRSLDAEPGNANAYNGRAEAYANLKDLASAHNDFVQAAEIFTVQKQYGNAIKAYNRALEVNPKSFSAYLGRGNLYLIQGQEIAAITDFDVAREMDDNNPQVYVGLGKARYNQQNYKKAIDHFKKARKFDPANPVPHQYLMLSYLATDKLKDVQKSYEEFKEVASEKDLSRFKTDNRYAAVMAVIEDK